MSKQYSIVETHSGTGFSAVNRYMKVRLNDGREFHVGVERGNRVRVAFKPRDFVGFRWHGFVRDVQGKTIWSGRVNKSDGAHAMLVCASLISCEHRGAIVKRLRLCPTCHGETAAKES